MPICRKLIYTEAFIVWDDMLILAVGDGERDWGALHYICHILPDSQCIVWTKITIHNIDIRFTGHRGNFFYQGS